MESLPKIFKYVIWSVIALGVLIFWLKACNQETQNRFSRALQNWTGTNGVLEIYAGDKLVKRFLKIDKLTTATGTDNQKDRPYRFGYGVLDENLSGLIEPGEKNIYFEFSDYSTSYIFFDSPHNLKAP